MKSIHKYQHNSSDSDRPFWRMVMWLLLGRHGQKHFAPGRTLPTINYFTQVQLSTNEFIGVTYQS